MDGLFPSGICSIRIGAPIQEFLNHGDMVILHRHVKRRVTAPVHRVYPGRVRVKQFPDAFNITPAGGSAKEDSCFCLSRLPEPPRFHRFGHFGMPMVPGHIDSGHALPVG